MTAQDRLAAALAEMVDAGRVTPCSAGGGLWLSEDPRERQTAARRCVGCPVFAACGQAAEEAGDEFGVWAGVDRTWTGRPDQRRQVSRPVSRPPVVIPKGLLISADASTGGVIGRPLSPAGSVPAGKSLGAAGVRLTPDRRGGAA